jgi:hypothetical protein
MAAHPQTKGATFYIEFKSYFPPNIFCELRSFMTIKTFFIRALLEENELWRNLHPWSPGLVERPATGRTKTGAPAFGEEGMQCLRP